MSKNDVDQELRNVSQYNVFSNQILPIRLMPMNIEKHTLLNDFPDHHHTIRHLKMNDNHFAKLFDEYHEIAGEVHSIEEKNQPVADEYLESLKVRRVHLKDQLFNLVVKKEKAL